MAGARRRLVVLFGLTLVPWTVVSVRGTPTLFFPLGFVTPEPFTFTTVWDYYLRYTAGLPRYLAAFGTATVLLGIAVISALAGVIDREDARITAAVVVLAGLNNLVFTLGFLRRPGYVAVPVGTLLCGLVVWWGYRPAFGAIVTDSER